jgi:hypothetical protein
MGIPRDGEHRQGTTPNKKGGTALAISKPLGHPGTLPLPEAPVTRAWHVTLNNGGGRTVAAHKCRIRSGVLSFYNVSPPHTTLVHAFAASTWTDAQLVVIDPVDVAIAHRPPPPEFVEHGVRWR